MTGVSVRGVRTILTKAKIDHSTLDMTEVRVTLDGRPETRVVVRGPRAARHAAYSPTRAAEAIARMGAA